LGRARLGAMSHVARHLVQVVAGMERGREEEVVAVG